MRVKLTQSFIDDHPPPEKDRVSLWDEDQPGFGAVVPVSGKRHFVIQYRLGDDYRTARGATKSANPASIQGSPRRRCPVP